MPPRHPNTPPPAPAEIARLIEDAYARRRAHDDPDLHLWSDSPAEAAVYLTTRLRVPHAVQVEDARAALRITRFLRDRLAALELAALTTCRTPAPGTDRPPATWASLADDLGVHTEQAALQRHRRLRRAASRQPAAARSSEDRARTWTLTHGDRVRTAAAALLRARLDVEAAGSIDAIEWFELLDAAVADYRGSHTNQAALLAMFRQIRAALPGKDIPAVRTAGELADEYTTYRDGRRPATSKTA